MSAFLSTPIGFHSSLELLNSYPAEVVTNMIEDANLSTPAAALGVKYAKRLSALGVDASSADPTRVTGAFNAIVFVLRSVRLDRISSAELLVPHLLKHTSLTQATAELIAAALTKEPSEATTAVTAPSAGFSLGKVVGFDWKIGVGIASSECANLKAPYISVVWKIADANGTRSYPMELTVPQFRELLASFTDLDAQLEAA